MQHRKKIDDRRRFTKAFLIKKMLTAFLLKTNADHVKKSSHKAGYFIFLPILLLLVPAAYTFVDAAEVTLTPRIGASGAYDDNLLYSAEDKLSSSIVVISPSLDFDYKTLLSSVELKADLDILNYLDESDLDRTNQYYRLKGTRQIKERWDTTANLNYYRDTTLNSYLQEIGRVIERIERDYFDAGGSVSYNLTRVSGVGVGYRYQTVSYDDDAFTDYDSHRGNLFYKHRLKSEVDTLYFGPSYYHRRNDFNDVDSFSLNIGWDRDWSDITKSEASIGARYANVTRNDGSEDDNWGVIANLDFTFQGVATTTIVRYFHDLRTTNAGDDINVDNFYLSYRRSITERFGIGFDGRLVFSYKLLDQQSDINDSRYYWLEPRLFYRLTEHLSLSLRYRYQNNVEFVDEGDRTRERNTVQLELSYGLPILL